MSSRILNPVLPGFNPDPSILRVGRTWYVATSTFEWFPGVRIHQSADLANWELAALPLSRGHINMRGNPSSGGIWAPCLSWDGALFHLIYTDVKFWDNASPFKDQKNFLITAPSIDGPWSEPVYLNSSGFDPSLFHDRDGRKWLVNMEWDHRKEQHRRFSGILMQEYDSRTKALTGPITKIFRGSALGLTEAPHLYRKDGWYYLLTAEGGTSYEHAATIARSRDIEGPYELPDHHPLLSSRNTDPEKVLLQKAGHGSLAEDAEGNWYLAHLCGRPLPGTDRCVLGRETAIQEIVWKDGWPRLKGGGNTPADSFTVPWDVKSPEPVAVEYRFTGPDLPVDFQSLREELPGDVLSVGDGVLKLRGRDSVLSRHDQSLAARRQEHFSFTAEMEMEFQTRCFQKMAGLSYRYDEDNQYFLYVSWDEEKNSRVVELMKVEHRNVSYLTGGVPIDEGPLKMRLQVTGAAARFFIAPGNSDGVFWTPVGPECDTTILSDDFVLPMGFTGAFIGMACCDLQNRSAVAAFRDFRYQPAVTEFD